MWIAFLTLLPALAAPDATARQNLRACCAGLDARDCPEELLAVGPGSSPLGTDSVRGIWHLTCTEGAGYFAAATARTPDLRPGRVFSPLSPDAASCFEAACPLPVGLCFQADAVGYAVVDCRTGGGADQATWGGATLAPRTPVIAGSRAVGVQIVRVAMASTSPAAATPSPWGTPATTTVIAAKAPPPAPAPVAAPAPRPVPAAVAPPRPAAPAAPAPANPAPSAVGASPSAVPIPVSAVATSFSAPAQPAATAALSAPASPKPPSAPAGSSRFDLPNEPPEPCIPNPALRAASLEQSDLGDEKRVTSDMDAALGHYRAAITINACNGTAWGSLGSALLDAGDADQGARALRVAARLQPTNPRAWAELGRAHEARGDAAAAVAAYQEALSVQEGYRLAEEGLRRVSRMPR